MDADKINVIFQPDKWCFFVCFCLVSYLFGNAKQTPGNILVGSAWFINHGLSLKILDYNVCTKLFTNVCKWVKSGAEVDLQHTVADPGGGQWPGLPLHFTLYITNLPNIPLEIRYYWGHP